MAEQGANGISWTDRTWNPVVGCTKVSQGCKHCYAKMIHDMRHKAHQEGKKIAPQYAHPFETVQLMDARLTQPLSWRKPQRVFVNSVSDLFHEDVPDEFLDRAFAVMALAGRHTFQVLTKRPERMRAYFANQFRWAMIEGAAQSIEHRLTGEDPSMWLAVPGPLPNVWLGTSVENQQAADERIPHLLETPAAVRFLSCEPLLGPVVLSQPWCDFLAGWTTAEEHVCGGDNERCWRQCPEAVQAQTQRIDWVIVGGESGKGARPMHPDWARDIRTQCTSAGVAFHFKQWGEWRPNQLLPGGDLGGDMRRGVVQLLHGPNGEPGHFRQGDVYMRRVGTKAAGRLLDGVLHDAFPGLPLKFASPLCESFRRHSATEARA